MEVSVGLGYHQQSQHCLVWMQIFKKHVFFLCLFQTLGRYVSLAFLVWILHRDLHINWNIFTSIEIDFCLTRCFLIRNWLVVKYQLWYWKGKKNNPCLFTYVEVIYRRLKIGGGFIQMKVGRGWHNMRQVPIQRNFGPSCIHRVYFLHKSTDFYAMRT